MAQGNVDKFIEQIRCDEELQAKLKEATDTYDGPKDDRALFEAIVEPLAEQAGLPFTFEEALAATAAERDLSDEEVEAMAGGAGCYVFGGTDEGFEAGVGDSIGTMGICFYAGITFAIFE